MPGSQHETGVWSVGNESRSVVVADDHALTLSQSVGSKQRRADLAPDVRGFAQVEYWSNVLLQCRRLHR